MSGACVPRRILLLDDDPFFLGVQAKLLHRLGCEVRTAASADAALALLLRHEPCIEVVVCDLNMPGVDGIEFLQRLAATPWSGHVILQSGEGGRIVHSVRRLLQRSPFVLLGAVEKPASPADYRRLLECIGSRDKAAAAAPRPSPPISEREIEEASRHDQWVLHYQPKVDMRTGELRGVEALLRWNHPRHGLLSPDSFIPLAEASGGIDALTDWVLRKALRQMARWMERGEVWPIAINLSMRNLESPGFARRLMDLFAGSPVSPADVTLEITESHLMSPSLEPLMVLVRLRMQRFALSIDDFGTGYSSLAQLRDVPFTELKIDRGFVSGARHNDNVRPILEGSIGIARGLGLQSVAEGVETEDDWLLLQELGCDVAQGWFIGAPMEAERLPEWRRAWLARRCALVLAPSVDGESALATLI
jgi:EAL domain-containing protein (putative c-di-GMP-specific phosphodiesterase class I)